MKHLILFSLVFIIVGSYFLVKPIQNQRLIVPELFTSQGCSSCLPADRLLSEVNNAYGDQEVIANSYHVDY